MMLASSDDRNLADIGAAQSATKPVDAQVDGRSRRLPGGGRRSSVSFTTHREHECVGATIVDGTAI
jgi:hypothetical protein